MPKVYSECKLCKVNHFLNFAGLCKRCIKKSESTKIIQEAIARKDILLKAKKALKKEMKEIADAEKAKTEEEAKTEEKPAPEKK